MCSVIDIAVGLDISITKNVHLKHDNCIQLSSELKQLYPNVSFEIVPIVLGATGLATSHLRKKHRKSRHCKHWWYVSKMSTNGSVGNNEDSKIGYDNEKWLKDIH